MEGLTELGGVGCGVCLGFHCPEEMAYLQTRTQVCVPSKV